MFNIVIFSLFIYYRWAGIAKSVRAGRYGDRIPVRGGGDLPRTSRPNLAPPSFLYKGYWVSFPEIKRPGRGIDHPPNLVPRLKKEYSYTCAFMACSRAKFTFFNVLFAFNIFQILLLLHIISPKDIINNNFYLINTCGY
jgi:hypothetical protein